jgi:glycosyltransferase involved in cell wall biosynthesis
MAKEIKLSVVIPVYNREAYIVDCVNSVLNQKNPGCAYEVIVVDDGSTDNSAELLKQFGTKITFRSIKGSTRPAVPRNIGIGLAKGEYIAFQDSDDLWVPNKLELQLPDLVKSKAALSYGNAAIIESDGKATSNKILYKNDQFLEGDVFEELVVENYVPTLTTIVRKDVIQKLGGFDESMELRAIEDYHLWLRIAAKYSVTSKNVVLAKYRSHEDNISTHDPIVSFKRQDAMLTNLTSQHNFFSPHQIQLLKNKQKRIRNLISEHSSSFLDKSRWKLKSKLIK